MKRKKKRIAIFFPMHASLMAYSTVFMFLFAIGIAVLLLSLLHPGKVEEVTNRPDNSVTMLFFGLSLMLACAAPAYYLGNMVICGLGFLNPVMRAAIENEEAELVQAGSLDGIGLFRALAILGRKLRSEISLKNGQRSYARAMLEFALPFLVIALIIAFTFRG